jgi:ubiquinol-cytochrome c reductase cytochrome b subunit
MPTDVVRRRGLRAAVEERLGLSDFAYSVPRHANTIPFSLGGISLISFLLLVASGIMLTQFYLPIPEFANDSVRAMMSPFGLARFVRGVHYWAAQSFLVTVLLHMVRIYATASFKRPREANWLVGVLLLAISVGPYFTGTVLKWDQEGFEALEHNLAIGHLLGGLWHWFAPAFSQAVPLLLRLYVAHIVVLPAAVFFVLIAHFWLVRKHGISPHPQQAQVETSLRFTDHLAHLARCGAVLTGLILVLAVLFPPIVGPAPVEGIEVTKPPWPFLPLFAIENWVGIAGLLWVSIGVFLLLALVPLLDRSPQRRSGQRHAALVVGTAIGIVTIYLALLAWFTEGAKHIGMMLRSLA